MIGATLSLAIVLWLASSYVEYKIVKSSPHLQRYFHGVGGIIISVVISMALGLLLAPAAGVAVLLAAFMGLASNEFTFKLYSNLHSLNVKRTNAQHKIKNAQHKVQGFKTAHPTVFHEAVEGIKAGFKVIVAVFLAIIWIFGLPIRITRWIQTGYASAKSTTLKVLPSR